MKIIQFNQEVVVTFFSRFVFLSLYVNKARLKSIVYDSGSDGQEIQHSNNPTFIHRIIGPRVKALDTLEPDGEPTRVELAILIRDHGARVRALIRAAIAELDPPQREVLRLEIVEGLPHHQIAALAGVHRTTIVRRIEEARQRIADRIRGTLRAELAIGANTADSLLRTFAGIDVSLASALRG